MARALLGLHVFTGCDSVSAFVGKGKKKGFDLLRNSDSHQQTFGNLGSTFDMSDDDFCRLEKFVCELYGQDDCSSINEARYRIFSLSGCDEQKFLHAQRANYQTCINRLALDRHMEAPSPNDHGWVLEKGTIRVRWISQDPIPREIMEIDSCKCKTGCVTNRCTCKKSCVTCTDLCGCSNCENIDSQADSNDDDTELIDSDSDDE